LANRRLKGFQPSRAHVNTDCSRWSDITARARWLVRNNGYAANAIESWAGNVVGVRIPASEIVHVIDPVDAGQLRGVSRFAAGIVKPFLLDPWSWIDRQR
jgi:capsid protein